MKKKGLFIGISVAVVAIAVVTFFVIKKKKEAEEEIPAGEMSDFEDFCNDCGIEYSDASKKELRQAKKEYNKARKEAHKQAKKDYLDAQRQKEIDKINLRLSKIK